MRLLASISKMLCGLSADTTIGKILIFLGSALVAFYSPVVALLVCCFVFTIIDMFYGIKVSRKFKKKITSNKSWKGTITKLVDEWVVISLARLLEMSVFGADGVSVLTGGATVIVGLTELWSILENLNTLNPKGPWKALGAFLKKKGEEYVGTEIELDDYATNNNVDSN